MRRIIYSAFIAIMIFGCKQENFEPAVSNNLASNIKQSNCSNYPGWNEPASKSYLLVGFKSGTSENAKIQAMRSFTHFDFLEPDYPAFSGPVSVAILKPGTTCSDVAKMLKVLEAKQIVNWAYPVFDRWDPTTPYTPYLTYQLWTGLTNEFYVSIADENDYQALLQLIQQTKTHIVYADYPYDYLLSADKNSTGNTFQVCDIFRQSPIISYVEPNLLDKYVTNGARKQLQSTSRAMQVALK